MLMLYDGINLICLIMSLSRNFSVDNFVSIILIQKRKKNEKNLGRKPMDYDFVNFFFQMN